MAHKDQTQLLKELENLKSKISVGDKYECPGYPEVEYVITEIGFIEATEDPCIVYKKKENGITSWVRTQKEYLGKDILKTNKDDGQLKEELKQLNSKITEDEKWYHYKHHDQHYKIVGIGFIERTGELCVVYRAEYGDKITWVGTEEEFFAKVTLGDGTKVDRFAKVI